MLNAKTKANREDRTKTRNANLKRVKFRTTLKSKLKREFIILQNLINKEYKSYEEDTNRDNDLIKSYKVIMKST